MATLILNANGTSPITVLCQRAGKSAPRNVGGVTASYNGALRSMVRGQAKVIPILASYVDTATEATIQAAVMNGVQIACSGDILQNIQTQCSFENVVSNMIPGLAGFFEMSFTLNEVQASVVLLKYAPGDTITGESFTRSTIATYFDAAGVLQNAAINTKRDGHYGPYDAASRTTRMTLLEDTRTNHILQCCDFSNASWIKSNVTVTTGVGGMRSGVTGNTLTATAPNAFVIQTPAASSSVVRSNSIWARRRTGTGQVELYDVGGVAFQILNLTTNFKRFTITSAASTARQFQIVIRTSGDAIDVENAQVEDGAFASSEILTTTVAVTRAADSYSLPFTTPPQEMTVYAKFVEGGTTLTAGAHIASFTNVGGSAPLFEIGMNSRLRAYHNNAVNAVASEIGISANLGDTTEVVARLSGDGSVDYTQSINSAAAVDAGQSGNTLMTLGAAWGGQIVWLNSQGTGNLGFTAIQSFKIVAGARSVAEMRAA